MLSCKLKHNSAVHIDPMSRKYLDLSPYNFVANSPIAFLDPDGERIGKPFSAFTREVRRSLNKSDIGKMLWKKMKKSHRVFYFHQDSDYPLKRLESFSGNNYEYITQPNANFQENIAGWGGMMASNNKFEHMFKTVCSL